MNDAGERGRLVVVSDEAALAQAVAEHVIDCGRRALAERGVYYLALAGGSTPKAAYELLAGPAFRSQLDWTAVRFFFGDERCVPPADDQSNYKMAKRALLDPLGIDAGAVFRMHGEAEPQAAARDYADVLRREIPNSGGPPALDLIMLGMGPDGHTASLFPGSDPRADDAALVRAVYVAKFSTFRITLTPGVLCAARSIAVATAGDAKAAALAAVLDGPEDVATYPIQVLVGARERLVWLVDRAAAARLQGAA